MRQLANASGAVVLTKSYQPYGTVLSSAGSGTTAFGFTGEWTDSTGLIYLRARSYSPAQSRFITKDIWPGDYNKPMSLDKFVYGYSNPIRFTDPSGQFSRQQIALSFGKNSFKAVLDDYNDQAGPWGLLASLLRALPGDTLSVGAPVLAPNAAYGSRPVDWRGIDRVGYDPAMGITVNNQDLQSFMSGRMLQEGMVGTGQALIWWRDTSPHYYRLIQTKASAISQYVDGSDYIDLPDFVSVDMGVSVDIIGATLSPVVADRYGNRYWSLLVGPAPGLPVAVAYSEGYLFTGSC